MSFINYRFARRSFLRSIGAAAGLRTILRNLEASAQAKVKAPRFVVTHRPIGTVRPYWVPTGTGTSYTVSPLLRPFTDKGLREDMAILFGLSTEAIRGPGGGHEKGTVTAMTGAPTRYTRAGQPEQDDPCADAPSMDQVFLAKAAGLQGRPIRSLQLLCDDRIDFQEVSTRCLSYDYTKQAVSVVNGSNYQEAKPMRGEMRPYNVYTRIFGSIMPGDPNIAAINRARANKKSMLDFSRRELARLRTLCPASEKVRLDAHLAAIQQVEVEIGGPTVDGSGQTPSSCGIVMPPDMSLVGGIDNNASHNNYNNCTAEMNFSGCTAMTSDQAKHEQVARAHWAVLKAALKCDFTRVATFQLSPGTNHVAFGGYWPSNPAAIYMHHPVSHNIPAGAGGKGAFQATSIPTNPSDHLRFLVGIETWYNTLMADFFAQLKAEADVYGNNLLESTVIPYVTEVAHADHAWKPLPVCVFGGKALGMVGGQFIDLGERSHNDMWYSCARAFGLSTTELRSDAESAKAWSGTPAVINGLWVPPPA